MSYRINISKQIANDYGIDMASEEGQLIVYRLTLESIGNTLLYEDPETITQTDLTSFKKEMSNILRFSYHVHNGDIGDRLDIESIIAMVNTANTDLLSASSVYKLLMKNPQYYGLYYGHLQNFRHGVFQIKEQLEEP